MNIDECRAIKADGKTLERTRAAFGMMVMSSLPKSSTCKRGIRVCLRVHDVGFACFAHSLHGDEKALAESSEKSFEFAGFQKVFGGMFHYKPPDIRLDYPFILMAAGCQD